MMVENKKFSLIVGLLFIVLLGACNFSTEWVDQDQIDAQSTASHETVIAKLTEIAALFTQTPVPDGDETNTAPTSVPVTFTPTQTATTAPTSTCSRWS